MNSSRKERKALGDKLIEEAQREELEHEEEIQLGYKASWQSALLHAREFSRTGNSIEAMRSFLAAQESGQVPPESIMNWVADAFRNHLFLDKSLYDSFKLKTAKHTYRKEYLNELMGEMWRLQQMFQIKYDDAAYLVERRLERLKTAPETVPNVEIQKTYALKDKRGEVITYQHGTLCTYWCNEPGAYWRKRSLSEAERARIWPASVREIMFTRYPQEAWPTS